MRASGANQAVWRTGGGWMGVSGANLAVWRTGGGLDEGLVSKQGGLAHGRRPDGDPREQTRRFGAREETG